MNAFTSQRTSSDRLPTVMGGKIQSLRNELATTEQRIAEINGRRAYLIRAPAAGRVSTVQATIGQFADTRRLQMEISRMKAHYTPNFLFPREPSASSSLGRR